MTRETIFRILITLTIVLITQLKVIEYYGELSSCLIFILLIFDLFERNHFNDSKPELIYNLSWVTIGLSTFLTRGSYIGPYSPIFLILIIKLITLLLFYLKYRSLCVTRTILSKLCLVSVALYFIELLANSTHGLGSTTLFWTKLSSAELFLILLTKKDRIKYKWSILDSFGKK